MKRRVARDRQSTGHRADWGAQAPPAWSARHHIEHAADTDTADAGQADTQSGAGALFVPATPSSSAALAPSPELPQSAETPGTGEPAGHDTAGVDEADREVLGDIPGRDTRALAVVREPGGRHRSGRATAPVDELLQRGRAVRRDTPAARRSSRRPATWAEVLGADPETTAHQSGPNTQLRGVGATGRYRPLADPVPGPSSGRLELVPRPTVGSGWRPRNRRRDAVLSSALLAVMLLAGSVVAYQSVTSALSPSLPPADTSPYGATGAMPGSLNTPLPGASTGPVQDAGLPPIAGVAGIPATVLLAYHSAETQLAGIAPGCRLSWSLLAGIGKIESGHARGGEVDSTGTTTAPILGPALDGTGGNAAISDTDSGALDGDTAADRAVGPMQFLPSTWRSWGVDANNDARTDPSNTYDAATAAGRYLCAGDLDTSTPGGAHDAVFRYNHSESYVADVLAWARAYAGGTIPLPDNPAGPTSLDHDGGLPTGATSAPDPAPSTSSGSDPWLLAAPAPSLGSTGSPVGSAPTPAAGSTLIPITGAPAIAPPPAAPSSPRSAPSSPPVAITPPGTSSASPVPGTTAAATSSSAPSTPTTVPIPATAPSATTTSARSVAPTPPAPTTTTTPAATTTTTTRRPAPVAQTSGLGTKTPTRSTPPGRSGSSGSPGSASGSGSSVSGSGGGGSSLDTTQSGIGVLLEGQLQAEGASRPALTTTGGTPGVRFAVPGGGRRSEVIAPLAEYQEGQQMWLHYRAQLAGVPVDTTTWQLVAQFHQDGGSGSPPVALEVGRGRLRLASQGSNQQDLGPISADGVLDVVMHVVFSRDPERAQVDVWRDGTAVLSDYHPPGGTLLDGGDYLKLGLYRDPAITEPSTITALTVQAGPAALPGSGSGGS